MKSLIETYRDLLLLKFDSKCQSLISDYSNIIHLQKLASHTEFEILYQGLQQLIQSEELLKTSLNAAVWLEICLLKLIPSTPIFISEKSIRNGQEKTSKSQSQINPSCIWKKVVESVKPNNRRVLSLATLITISEQEAVLKVPSLITQFRTWLWVKSALIKGL
ncbi:hypothetical protein [Gloeothece verrucosa]|uniref:hypothetical protein n=1 Tax=Gloeothece verrucosa TaxID=2546359 RepID=UPI00017E175E|nr:hypothetical protein [Gloeothece verrucosa]